MFPVDAATSGASSSSGLVNGVNIADLGGSLLNSQAGNAGSKKLRNADSAIEKLDLAMLSFFEQFRKIYVGDQVQKTSKVYRKLSEVLGLQDESMVSARVVHFGQSCNLRRHVRSCANDAFVTRPIIIDDLFSPNPVQVLSVIIQKIITNLKFWGASETIISKTLQLLNDLSVGYSSVRKLIKLDAVQFMLSHHTSDNFPFLGFAPTPGTAMLQVSDMVTPSS